MKISKYEDDRRVLRANKDGNTSLGSCFIQPAAYKN